MVPLPNVKMPNSDFADRFRGVPIGGPRGSRQGLDRVPIGGRLYACVECS